MSASRDQSQKIAFVYSNLYKIYQKGKSAAQDAQVPVAIKKPLAQSSHVIKASEAKVSAYNPTEFIGRRVAKPAALQKAQAGKAPAQPGAPKEAILSLKDNLKALNDLHSRLRFMLQELEDLVKN